MKKIYTVIAVAALTFGANAQNKEAETGVHPSGQRLVKHVMPSTGMRAAGDTLFYIPLPGYQINSTDAAAFGIVNEDNDGLTTNTGAPGNWAVYYSTDSSIYGQSCAACSTPHGANYYHPWETPAPAGNDTTRFWSATSWFNPAGQADNWLEFGPITVPAAGATIVWYERFNRYRDGYSLLVADGNGYDATSSPFDFTAFDISTAVYTLADDPYPSATYATDTTWALRTATVPASFNGQPILFAFHHTANDQDVLRLDEIAVVEGTNLALGVADNKSGTTVSQNKPNPFSNSTVISYDLEKSAVVSLAVYDVTGKKVASQSEGTQLAGSHNLTFNASDLSAGVYYYSLTVGENAATTMKMVVIK